MNYNLKHNEKITPLEVQVENENRLRVTEGEMSFVVDYLLVSDHHLHLSVNGKHVNAFVDGSTENKTVLINGFSYQLQDADALARTPRKKGTVSNLPMEITPRTPSVVVSVLVTVGSAVSKGQEVVVLSAMKMETTLKAPFNGTVTAVNVGEGDKVAPGDILVDIEKSDEEIAAVTEQTD